MYFLHISCFINNVLNLLIIAEDWIVHPAHKWSNYAEASLTKDGRSSARSTSLPPPFSLSSTTCTSWLQDSASTREPRGIWCRIWRKLVFHVRFITTLQIMVSFTSFFCKTYFAIQGPKVLAYEINLSLFYSKA